MFLIHIGHWKWFLNTNLFLIKPFLITKFDFTWKTNFEFRMLNFKFEFRISKSWNLEWDEIHRWVMVFEKVSSKTRFPTLPFCLISNFLVRIWIWNFEFRISNFWMRWKRQLIHGVWESVKQDTLSNFCLSLFFSLIHTLTKP